MATKRKHSTKEVPLVGRQLISWPLALIGLTLAFLFIANTVSAWGQRGVDDIEDIKSHAERFIDRALDRLDASDEQSVVIQTIVAATINDLHNARGAGDERSLARRELRNLLLADSIDRGGIEQFRQSQMARAEEMSQIVAAGLADIMDILTPEQRRELEAHFDQHHGRRRGWGWH
jgi:Spy/CpxP family protein refolding chaperone